MSSGGPRLGHVEPRERVGAQTGRKYEYQYERTARAALDLLAEDAKHVCVYCDWHDDYVIETGQPPACYVFHQVKGRKLSQGPWKFTDFFGVKKKESAKPSGSLLVSRSGGATGKRKSFCMRALDRRLPIVSVLPHIIHFYR
jgi:hypothetical protein